MSVRPEPQLSATTQDALRPILRRRQNKFLGFFKSLLKKPPAVASLVVILVIIFAAIFANVVAPYDPLELHPVARLKPPNPQYLLGTDNLGRDVFSRVIHGARISLYVSIAAVALAQGIGSSFGIVSGYFGARTDAIIMRVMDAIYAFPQLVLALAMVAMLGQSTNNVIYAIAFTSVPPVSRVLRGATLSVKQNEYVLGARAMGATHLRILLQHILPNVLPLIIVYGSLGFAGAILVEASLSFLGLGTPPPAPSWGGMLSSSGRQYFEVAPWLAIWPGVAITLATWSFNLFGDALRDILDPRMRGAS